MTKPDSPAATTPAVIAVAADRGHHFSKPLKSAITLVKGIGVCGDAHSGKTVQHLFDKKRNPDAPNLRQVHLIQGELLIELAGRGFEVQPGQMGENITTFGIDLLSLPQGAQLSFPGGALIELTGLRKPCSQLDGIAPGLLKAVIDKDVRGAPVYKSGVMGIVIKGGDIHPGDAMVTAMPGGLPLPLVPV